MSKLKISLILSISTISSTILASVVGQAFLRNFYRLLSFDEMFSGIFSQITDVKMTSPIIILLVIALLGVFAVIKLRKHKVLATLAVIVLTVVLFIVAILFTKVNGILFGDVVRTLVPLLESGAI